ncbi:MAG: flagellar export chaperone FlgN [Synergistaceae bacterium]|nr:flagellar export chaperone FlgN [Synergistaceae bacterium]
MRAEVEELINAVVDEADCIDDLVEVIREQREAMRRRDTESVNELMDEARDIFFETQTHDAVRSDSAKKLAAKLMCEPVASSIATKLENDERPRFNGAADRLTQSIFVLKSEMMIISGLIDQNEKFSAMLLSEYRRISSVDVAQSGSAEFRG